jgi:hypothetical protein
MPYHNVLLLHRHWIHLLGTAITAEGMLREGEEGSPLVRRPQATEGKSRCSEQTCASRLVRRVQGVQGAARLCAAPLAHRGPVADMELLRGPSIHLSPNRKGKRLQ